MSMYDKTHYNKKIIIIIKEEEEKAIKDCGYK